MSLAQRLYQRRTECGLSRAELAETVGVTRSAIGNYETGFSKPKDEILLRLMDALQVDANYLYQDDIRADSTMHCSDEERRLVEGYRRLSVTGRQSVYALVDSLCRWQQELEEGAPQRARVIPLYESPAAAGYAAPVFGEDFQPLEVTGEVPQGAELAVRIQGDSMEPRIADGSVVYVNHDPLANGDVGIFCVDGEMVCKQYYKDPLGVVYLFSLNRDRADADVVLTPGSGRSLTCFGRVMIHSQPLPR